MSTTWALDEGFRLLGRAFRIRTTSVACAEVIRRVLRDCVADVAPDVPLYDLTVSERRGPSGSRLTVSGETWVPSADTPTALAALVWRVVSDAVAATRDLLLVHAGAVVAPGAGAVVLPAASGGGKTTLVAGLCRAGFSYLSDEVAAIDPATDSVLPVPRAMLAKPGTLEALRVEPPTFSRDAARLLHDGWPLRPEDLGASIGAAATIRTVVVATYRAGSATGLEPISRAAGVAELARHCFNLASFGPTRGLELLARAIRNAACYRLGVDSLDDAVAAVASAARS